MILKYLDLSSRHVKYSTMNPVCTKYLVAEYEYGSFYYVPDEEEIDADTPEDLAAVLQFAKDNDCTLVRFDSFGDELNELEVYEW